MVRHERVHGGGDRIPQEPAPRTAGDRRSGRPAACGPRRFRYNAELDTIDIGGHDFARRKKYQDVQRNPRVAFLVDDLASVNPWRVRGIEVRGEAEVLTSGGEALGPGFAPEMFRLRARRIVSWGIMGNMVPAGRSVS